MITPVPSLPGQVIGARPRGAVDVVERLAVEVERDGGGVGREIVRGQLEGHHRTRAAGEERVADAPGALQRRQRLVVEADVGAPAPGPPGDVDIGQQMLVGEGVDHAPGPNSRAKSSVVTSVRRRVERVAPAQRGRQNGSTSALQIALSFFTTACSVIAAGVAGEAGDPVVERVGQHRRLVRHRAGELGRPPWSLMADLRVGAGRPSCSDVRERGERRDGWVERRRPPSTSATRP